MINKNLLRNSLSLSICSLVLCNCATISKYRGKSSDRVDPKKATTETLTSINAEVKPGSPLQKGITLANTPSQLNYNTSNNIGQSNFSNSEIMTGVRSQRRQVGGLLHPDADKLPTKEDLQEVQPITPNTGNGNGINIPVEP